jgi:hypothetical protein
LWVVVTWFYLLLLSWRTLACSSLLLTAEHCWWMSPSSASCLYKPTLLTLAGWLLRVCSPVPQPLVCPVFLAMNVTQWVSIRCKLESLGEGLELCEGPGLIPRALMQAVPSIGGFVQKLPRWF